MAAVAKCKANHECMTQGNMSLFLSVFSSPLHSPFFLPLNTFRLTI